MAEDLEIDLDNLERRMNGALPKNWRAKLNDRVIPIRRHAVVGRVELEFDSARGVIRVLPPGDGARLQIEDDMLEAELRPDRTQYAAMELQPLLPVAVQQDLQAQPAALAALWPQLEGLYRALAAEYGVFLLPGTLPVPTAAGVVNRAHLFSPEGGMGWQDKLRRTRFEAEQWGLVPGEGQSVFQTPLGRLETPEDVAKAVLFLCSDLSGFITGESLNVTGGVRMD